MILVHQVVHELVQCDACRAQKHAWDARAGSTNPQVTSRAGDYGSRGCRFESCRAIQVAAGSRRGTRVFGDLAAQGERSDKEAAVIDMRSGEGPPVLRNQALRGATRR